MTAGNGPAPGGFVRKPWSWRPSLGKGTSVCLYIAAALGGEGGAVGAGGGALPTLATIGGRFGMSGLVAVFFAWFEQAAEASMSPTAPAARKESFDMWFSALRTGPDDGEAPERSGPEPL